ncbi:nitrite/sulfite reductase [Usitatibacter palustris]|uniref:Sulfite reductase [ferredoxin] n=1 Tax=Usitatibacter palustris TaxID=2732487 RepID=A0A6M4HAW5_9PROT|nr:nitrite/sulfite reductase [Usitatibacter palustris]QJR15594.1 Sulfite reductase [ferredoxin] [Usitatibacter palustris]
MYRYDAIDHAIVADRVAQFRDQTRRFLAGQLTEDEFRPLRLQNGLYIQRHAPMLRVAVPYGILSSTQLRRLARIARVYDRGYGHFTTRQNIQYNWPKLEQVPEILAELAEVEMHAIQTSGNCVRNITTDHFAGVAPDEHVDPRALSEILRQWSTFHPEFAYLPRKFKIALNGADDDRAATLLHDIGLHAVKNNLGELGLRVIVGGGMGRTPMIGHVIREFLPWRHMLTYVEAVLRVYNRFGRRDNMYKARIKILVKAIGPEEFARQVETEWALTKDSPSVITNEEYERVAGHFTAPAYEKLPNVEASYIEALADSRAFSQWTQRNVHAHKVDGYAAVTLSLKKSGVPPGDATAEQMDWVADLADRYSFGELRVSHEQNLILSDVKKRDLFELWLAAKSQGLATPNVGLLTNIVCCPGGDFCSLANAKSIPIAQAIQERFDDLDYLHDIGELDLNISGCMNSCGHHHIGHIGILGVDKNGAEWYQISIGGAQGTKAALGDVIGPSFAAADVPDVISKLIDTYVEIRHDDEPFVDTVHRVGIAPFKSRVYSEEKAVAHA